MGIATMEGKPLQRRRMKTRPPSLTTRNQTTRNQASELYEDTAQFIEEVARITFRTSLVPERAIDCTSSV